MNKRIFFYASLFLSVLFLKYRMDIRPIETTLEENETKSLNTVKKKLKTSYRSPASMPAKPLREPEKSTYSFGDRSDDFQPSNEFYQEVAPTTAAAEEIPPFNQNSQNVTSRPFLRYPSSERTKTNPSQKESESNVPRAVQGLNPLMNSPLISTNDPAPSESKSGGTSEVSTLNCSASIGGGTFSERQSIGLSCSSSANIQYCVSETTCCDPLTGSTYSSPILLGENSKTFCLSFVGKNSRGESSVSNSFYTFNNLVPDVSVTSNKKYYQTTQLRMLLSMTSLDFGNANHEAGIINLRSRDPGTSGYNLSCEEVMNDYGTYSSPIANVALSPVDVSGVSSSVQLEAFLNVPEIVYGQNYLFSYISNTADSLIGCTTNLYVLEDFAYFDYSSSHGEEATGDVREFSGAFSSFSTIGSNEPYRGPASTTTSEEMRTNLFEIFYQ